ncbi:MULTISPECIES: hypothetical protein [Psychrilyobacter]|uniref:hypothetical protein n=1 Tax=Psychrilyobacter TaxID=623282 RepID=UPI001314882D|nr:MULTISPECIES: hypothetical protein [Psychrilyobacter]MCS5420744.1 hypothetical protein [Psychrilyobacter sp. S5]NDI77464.1 hypothetical protein [Psychrilyobacter piezotolerans]
MEIKIKGKIKDWDNFYRNIIPQLKTLTFRDKTATTIDEIESEAMDAYLLEEEVEWSY